MAKSRAEVVLMRESFCHFCGSDYTDLKFRRGRMKYTCTKCWCSSFIHPRYAEIAVLSQFTNMAIKWYGKKWTEVIESLDISDCTKLYCPICLELIPKIKWTKTKEYKYWKCGGCGSNGFVTPEMVRNWYALSTLVLLDRKEK